MSLVDKFKKLDVYKKIPKDVSEGTNIGGLISILTILTLLTLMFMEGYNFIKPQVRSELRPDDPITRQQMTINIDIEFPRYPCQIISLDIQDMLMSHHPNIGSVTKRRIDEHGNFVEDGNFQILSEPNQMRQYEIAKEAFQKKYGCRLIGSFTVKEVPGNFHVSTHAYQNLYSRLMIDGVITTVDTSHKIHDFYFGDKKNMEYVQANHPQAELRRLKNTQKIKEMPTTPGRGYVSHYHIDVVPTIYEDFMFFGAIKTFQYTYHHNYAEVAHMPAVFFNYGVGGMIVDIYPNRMSLLQFMIELCAIIGGAYMLASILDGLLNRAFGDPHKYELVS